jgi:hypothetical protein
MKIQSAINLEIVKYFKLEGIEFAYLSPTLPGKIIPQALTSSHFQVAAQSVIAN